jgi:hypothetical protein
MSRVAIISILLSFKWTILLLINEEDAQYATEPCFNREVFST